VNTAAEFVAHLRTLKKAENIAGQQRFGIRPKTEQLGISLPSLRALARDHRRNHALALELWASAIHEARILALFVEDWRQITRGQAEAWIRDCDSWALVDGCCGHLLCRTPFAVEKAKAWSKRKGEFVKRAGFSLMAGIAVHRKELPDKTFLSFFPPISRAATDERNFVKKAVNWALRQIGKRNSVLRKAAIAEAKRIRAMDSKSARWIAGDALRELTRQ
jgi:3-methyladenine DNA glycosylase AlkD